MTWSVSGNLPAGNIAPMNTTSSFASGFASGHSDAARRQVAFWLLVCAALVFVMVVVGGVTRLTRSGLSIVEWQPIAGTLPPLTELAWQDMFTKYQATPEYVKVNRGMSLDEFKGIFWWEYIHRLIGRTIGLVFFLPFVWFLAKRQIPWSAAPKYVGNAPAVSGDVRVNDCAAKT